MALSPADCPTITVGLSHFENFFLGPLLLHATSSGGFAAVGYVANYSRCSLRAAMANGWAVCLSARSTTWSTVGPASEHGCVAAGRGWSMGQRLQLPVASPRIRQPTSASPTHTPLRPAQQLPRAGPVGGPTAGSNSSKACDSSYTMMMSKRLWSSGCTPRAVAWAWLPVPSRATRTHQAKHQHAAANASIQALRTLSNSCKIG